MKNVIILFLIIFLFSCDRTNKPDKLILLEKANIYYEADNYGNALKLYEKYLHLDTTSGIVYYNKGFCEKMLFNYDISTLSLKKAIELNYRVTDANHNIAWNYAAIYNDSLALYFFKETYRLDSTDKDVEEQIEIFTHRLNRKK
jgi:tetratricopeptide (TPR) repeat protein